MATTDLWYYEECTEYVRCTENDAIVCKVAVAGTHDDGRLIAAAPELLMACRAALVYLRAINKDAKAAAKRDGLTDPQIMRVQIARAINAATGK